MFDRASAISAQEKYCKEKGYPHFAPRNGRCWHCGRNFYDEVEHPGGVRRTGISVERAGSELITGCPHCNRSYCD